MELINNMFHFNEYLSGLKKNVIKKIISPWDILFLVLSGLFISFLAFELSFILFNVINKPEDVFNYIFQMKYGLTFGFISIILFIATLFIWIKQKVSSLFSVFIPFARKKPLHWILLLIAFALNSFIFVI